MKILIVDDEALHRRGLRDMLIRVNPDFVVDTSQDGEDALKMAHRNDYDIIFTDIKMPVLNGIEFAEKINVQHTKIIIVSGYGEFEYAQQAMRIGIFDYLLKPVSKKKIVQILEKVMACIQEESNQVNEKKLLEDKINVALPIYVQNLLTMLVRGNIHDESYIDEVSKIIPSTRCGGVLIFQMPAMHRKDQGALNPNDIGMAVRETLREYGKFVSFRLIDEPALGFFRLVTLYFGGTDMALYKKENKENLLFKLRGIGKVCGISYTLGIGKPIEDLLSMGKTAYDSAMDAIEYTFYDDTMPCVFYDEIPAPLIHNPYYPKTLYGNILQAIRRGDTTAADQCLSEWMQSMLQTGFPYPSILKNEAFRACMEMAMEAENYLAAKEYEAFTQTISSQIEEASSYKTLYATVLKFIHETSGVFRTADSTASVRLTKALDYIDANIQNDISLENVSEIAGLNKTYFSHFFKTMIGVKFSDYVTAKRMELAKKHLVQSDEKVYKIAQYAGYRSPEYFNRTFKKCTGLSPEEYRYAYTER